ncbi:hypothetical protein EDD16DRAFT_376165 [Pisolithus croceorrhizus]|nr:hypothetical protein EDD16DRAFT_376165 [Pisolithus croceorrhizus]KAI6169865.1 hypothetical protein EDD17DRAFT_1522017 [Pisolithus thermaeus]
MTSLWARIFFLCPLGYASNCRCACCASLILIDRSYDGGCSMFNISITAACRYIRNDSEVTVVSMIFRLLLEGPEHCSRCPAHSSQLTPRMGGRYPRSWELGCASTYSNNPAVCIS